MAIWTINHSVKIQFYPIKVEYLFIFRESFYTYGHSTWVCCTSILSWSTYSYQYHVRIFENTLGNDKWSWGLLEKCQLNLSLNNDSSWNNCFGKWLLFWFHMLNYSPYLIISFLNHIRNLCIFQINFISLVTDQKWLV